VTKTMTAQKPQPPSLWSRAIRLADMLEAMEERETKLGNEPLVLQIAEEHRHCLELLSRLAS